MTDKLSSLADRTFDAIIVGSGAGGCAAAYRLVLAGLRVLLVEKGAPLPKDRSTLDVQQVIHDGVFKSTEQWVDRGGRVLLPEEHFNLGGKTKWYGAALARFSPHEFEADAEHQCLAWPFGYAELAPYYDEIEALLGVQPFPREPDLTTIVDALLDLDAGWRAEALPLGLAREILADAQEATHFDGFASPSGLKSDGESALLSRIANAPNLNVATGRAVATFVGAGGEPEHIVGVRLDDGTELRAREVLLAAGAMHSPRLLQRYLEANGLGRLAIGNVVGRNFKLHLLTAVLAFSPSRKTDLLRKTTLLMNERVPHSSVQPLGFDGELIATLIPRLVPRALRRELGARAYGFFLQTEDGSSPENRIRAADAQSDYPTVDYAAERTPAALAEHRRLVRLLMRDLLRAGYLVFSQRIGLGGTAHACGTLPTGTDPRSAAVDSLGRVHGLRGLTVVDGSILPRSSRVNPALTIYAWSLRAAAHVAARLRQGAAREPLAAERGVAPLGAAR